MKNKNAFISFFTGLFITFLIGLAHGVYFAIKYFRR